MTVPGRRVPVAVVEQVVAAHRGMCCLCRALVDPQSRRPLDFLENLEKHHLVFVSQGGSGCFDNLILVCPGCHARIHAHPEDYPVEALKARREHWVTMKEVVPARLRLLLPEEAPFSGVAESSRDEFIPVAIRLVSLGLDFQVEVPRTRRVSVQGLADFVREHILLPLARHDGNQRWLNATAVGLAHQSTLSVTLDPHLAVFDQLRPGDPLVPLLSVHSELAAVGAAPRPAEQDGARRALRRLENLQHTVRTLDEVQVSRLLLGDAATAARWGELVRHPMGRAWLKEIARDLVDWRWNGLLSDTWRLLLRPAPPWAEVRRHFAAQRERLRQRYDLTARGCGRWPCAVSGAWAETLWSVLIGLLGGVEAATATSAEAEGSAPGSNPLAGR